MKGEKKGLLKPTIQITVLSLLGIFLNFLTQLVVAYYFGATPERDAYFAAMALPSYITATLVGSLGVVFLPKFVDVEAKENLACAGRFLNNSLTLTVLVSGILILLGTVFSERLIHLSSPGFDTGQVSFTARLVAILFPTILFQVVSNVAGSVLQTKHQFIVPALAPLFSAVITLVVVWLLSPVIGITSLAYGTLAGNAISCVIILLYLKKLIPFSFSLDVKNPHMVKLLRLSLPLLLAGIFFRLTNVFERGMASYLPEGSMSYLGYANQIMTIFATVTSNGIATTLYPQLSKAWSENDMTRLRQLFIGGIRIVLLISIPISVIFIFWGHPLFRLLFERGAFTPEATTAVTVAFAILTVAFIANSLGAIVAKIFYFSGRTFLGSALDVMSTISYLLFAYFLSRIFLYKGLAMASSLSAIISIMASFISLYLILNGIDMKGLLKSIVAIILAAAIPMASLIGVVKMTGHDVNSIPLIIVFILIGVYFVCYYLLLTVFKTKELVLINDKVKVLYTKVRIG